jgi:hypothetical protein
MQKNLHFAGAALPSHTGSPATLRTINDKKPIGKPYTVNRRKRAVNGRNRSAAGRLPTRRQVRFGSRKREVLVRHHPNAAKDLRRLPRACA